MNDLIRTLKKHVAEQEKEYRLKRCDLEAAEKAYIRAVNEETWRKRHILSCEFLKVIELIHKHRFRCVSVSGVDERKDHHNVYTNPVFTICDDYNDNEYTDIIVDDAIVCPKEEGRLDVYHKSVQNLISDIERFCETV